MKTLFKIIGLFIFFIGTNVMAQNPDQNPNYKESQVKYEAQKDALTNNQGQTIQETYEAYDWTENKLKEKNARIQRRHEIRLRRHQRQRHTQCYSSIGYGSYYNHGYNNNNGYYNNGYYNNGNYANGCNSNCGNNYSNSITNWGSAALTTAVLGTTLYYLLK